MDKGSLSGFYREEKGKGLKKLREQGFVPGVIYGHNKESLNIKINRTEFERFIYSARKGSSVDLSLDNEIHKVIVKDVQKEFVKNRFLHVDFQELNEGEKVKVPVAIKILNRDKIEDSNSVLQEMFHELEVSVLPKDLIDTFDVDVSAMKLGDVIRLKDLEVYGDDRYDFVNHGDDILFVFNEAKKFGEAEEADAEDISVL